SNRQRVIAILLNGTSDSVFVNGIPYQGDMPSWKDLMTDFQIASVLTYIRAVLNDSTVTSCQPYDPSDPATQDPEGFALCTKAARTTAEIDVDSVAVWEVTAARD